MPLLPTWIVAIAVIVVLQCVTASVSRFVPVVAPAFLKEFGWHESYVGTFASAAVIGSLFVITAGIGMIGRLGGVGALQLALAISSASLVLFIAPSLTVALVASALLGLANGTANPVGSEVLQRFTPAAHRNFAFSVKQAGVPLGGVVVGLAAPFLVNAYGWRWALVVAAGAAILVTALTVPFRGRIDPPRDPNTHLRAGISFRPAHLIGPLRTLSSTPGLWRMSGVGGLLAFPQAVWVTFATTYLVVGLGLSLAVAGLVFAVMQAAGVFGRVALGWIADHVASPTMTLALAAVASAASTVGFGLVTADWPLWAMLALAAFAGLSVSGWNGVQIAEVAKRARPGLVGETAAGAVILVYAANAFGPIGFAAFVAVTGRFDVAFMIAGAATLLCLPLLWGLDRGTDKHRA
jgi:MFS family permease